MITYDGNRARWAFYNDAYWGGEFWRRPSSPTLGVARLYGLFKDDESGLLVEREVAKEQSYLLAHSGERPSSFRARHSLAVYVNFVAPIVDSYLSSVTGDVTRELGGLAGYVRNLDGKGKGWEGFIKELARWTLIHGFCAALLDAPTVNPAQSRADEEAIGVGFRGTVVQPPAIAWVDVDSDGALTEFAFVDEPYSATGAGYGAREVTYWVYDRFKWSKYTAGIQAETGYGEARGAVKKLKADASGDHSWPGKVPVKIAYFREMTGVSIPFGVSLIADIADIARSVYNKLSNIDDVHEKTAFPFLAVPTDGGGGMLEPDTHITIGTGTALGYPSTSGAPQWVQPTAEQTRDLREHAVFLIALAYRLAGIEISTDGASGVESGLAIQLKSQGFDRMALGFAQSVAEAEQGLLGLAASALGQSTTAVSVIYPSKFVLPDTSEDLARALLLLQTLGSQIGTLGNELAIKQAVASALNLPDNVLKRVMDQVRSMSTPKVPSGN